MPELHPLEGVGFWFLGMQRVCGPGDTPIGDHRPLDISTTPIKRQSFPVLGWDPILKAMAIAAEFAATGVWKKDEFCPAPGEPDDEDLRTLLEYRAERRSSREEIVAQAASFYDYFAQLLSASPPSRPHTAVLVTTGIYVGGLVASFWKLKYMRPRPVQVCPSVFPIIPTPPHPSYPSGHALESMLAAKCAALVAPDLESSLVALAKRIGVNREYAGVHYPSDTRAGQKLAESVWTILNDDSQVPEFGKLVALAKQEWPARAD